MSELSFSVASFGASQCDAVVMPAGSSELVSLVEGQRFACF